MLIGIGLGPGDPGLLTLRAVEALRQSTAVFVPGRMAARLVEPYAEPRILEFPMTRDKTVLQAHWQENADLVAEHARNGVAAFAIIGDPNFFSTFTYLSRIIRQKYPDIEIEIVPGISSITAFASRADIQIDTSFQVSDGSPVNDRIVLKARRPGQIVKALQSEGFDRFVFAQCLFSDNELIIKDPEDIPEKGDYFSIIHARKHHE